MKILRDEPQQLLVVEAPALGIPRGVGTFVKLLIFGFVVAPVFFFGASFFGPERPEPALIAFAVLFAIFWAFGVSRVRFDPACLARAGPQHRACGEAWSPDEERPSARGPRERLRPRRAGG